MTKKFFTKASPKAVEGIRHAYAGTGAEVSAVLDPKTGYATVVVSMSDDRKAKLKRRKSALHSAAA